MDRSERTETFVVSLYNRASQKSAWGPRACRLPLGRRWRGRAGGRPAVPGIGDGGLVSRGVRLFGGLLLVCFLGVLLGLVLLLFLLLGLFLLRLVLLGLVTGRSGFLLRLGGLGRGVGGRRVLRDGQTAASHGKEGGE